MAEGMGLYADTKSHHTIFEREMRRRLAWHVASLDSRSAHICESNSSTRSHFPPVTLPANLNDADLSPDMTELPDGRRGATEMIFCLLRYNNGRFIRMPSYDRALSDPETSAEEKDKLIDWLEEYQELNFLRYCEITIPLHLLSSAVARSIILKLRLIINHPRYTRESRTRMSQQKQDRMLSISLKIIEIYASFKSMEMLAGFYWHVEHYFNLDAFVYTIHDLCHRPSGPLQAQAWRAIENVYTAHSHILGGQETPLHRAMGTLTLKAWDVKMSHMRAKNAEEIEVPEFIRKLRTLQAGPEEAAPIVLQQPSGFVEAQRGAAEGSNATAAPTNEAEAEAEMDIPQAILDWEYWDSLMREHDTPFDFGLT